VKSRQSNKPVASANSFTISYTLFIHIGSGNDAIVASSVTDATDCGGNSNFLWGTGCPDP
jgi:hypothetical protein